MVTKEGHQEQNIGGGWHTDHSYDQEPALGSILVAKELPESGGDTWFTSMYKAYDSLSDGLKETLERMRAVHSAHYAFGTKSGDKQSGGTGGRIGNSDVADALENPVHPVVINHPMSGRKALYVNAHLRFILKTGLWKTQRPYSSIYMTLPSEMSSSPNFNGGLARLHSGITEQLGTMRRMTIRANDVRCIV